MKRKYGFLAVPLALSLCLTGCGTSVGSNTQNYFDQVGSIIGTLLASGGSSDSVSQTSKDALPKLDAPSDFTVDEAGNYSFGAVENADYYLIYMCDVSAISDEDDFIYSSDAISASGAESYSGNLNDVMNYAYGEYLVKVLAFPSLDDTEHASSSAATASYSVTGAMADPQIAYFWNTFSDTVDVQLANVGSYQYEVFPDKVTVTFTNAADASDVVNVEITDITMETYSMKSDAVLRGNTYDISAVAESSSPYVTNQTSQVVSVAKGVEFSDRNILVDGYSFPEGSNSFARGSGAFPNIQESFDPENGGVCGEAVANGIGGITYLTYTAMPTETADGALHSYTVNAPGFFDFTGTMNLYSDNSLVMLIDGPAGPVQPTQIEGIWFENEDGSVTLCYNPDSVTVVATE